MGAGGITIIEEGNGYIFAGIVGQNDALDRVYHTS